MAEGSLGAPCGDSPWSYVPPLRLGEDSELAIRNGDDVLSGRSVARAIGDAVVQAFTLVTEAPLRAGPAVIHPAEVLLAGLPLLEPCAICHCGRKAGIPLCRGSQPLKKFRPVLKTKSFLFQWHVAVTVVFKRPICSA